LLSESYDIPEIQLSYINQNWELKNLKPITLIFGKNGSGKSLYLRTLNRVNLENTTQSKDFHFEYETFYILPERTGPFQITNTNPANVQSVQKQMQFSEKNYVQNFNEYALNEFDNFFAKLGHTYEKDIQFEITSKYILNEVRKFFPNYKFEFNNQAKRLDVFGENGEGIHSDLLSSGESQLISICILLLTKIADWKLSNKKGLVLFDEPDLHLDPQMQERLALLISDLQKEYDVKFLIATHSIIFMTTLSLFNENVGNLYLERSKPKLYAKKLNHKFVDFEVFLTGKFLLGTLNEIPFLLVEGEDELQIFQTANRNPYFKSYVFPCQGNDIYQHQVFAEKLFESVYDNPKTFGVALLDGDKSSKNSPQSFIEFTKLQCLESENLYFSNEVLQDMIPNQSLLSKKIQELGLVEKITNKSKADFKDVIKKAAKELDPESLPWQVRLGKVIGKQRPSGELADMLGTRFLEILWPD